MTCDCHPSEKDQIQKKILITVLVINAIMFVVEGSAGIVAESSGLLADSLDMLADAGVYAIALWVVGKPIIWKVRSARLSGILQVSLGLLVLVDVIRKLFMPPDPVDWLIISVASVALVANAVCLNLLNPHQTGEVHMRATWIFTKNDVIANAGVIISGLLVLAFGSAIPDLVAGSIISFLVVHGGVKILRESVNG